MYVQYHVSISLQYHVAINPILETLSIASFAANPQNNKKKTKNTRKTKTGETQFRIQEINPGMINFDSFKHESTPCVCVNCDKLLGLPMMKGKVLKPPLVFGVVRRGSSIIIFFSFKEFSIYLILLCRPKLQLQ